VCSCVLWFVSHSCDAAVCFGVAVQQQRLLLSPACLVWLLAPATPSGPGAMRRRAGQHAGLPVLAHYGGAVSCGMLPRVVPPANNGNAAAVQGCPSVAAAPCVALVAGHATSLAAAVQAAACVSGPPPQQQQQQQQQLPFGGPGQQFLQSQPVEAGLCLIVLIMVHCCRSNLQLVRELVLQHTCMP
jgi:hypothetical protein